MTLLQASDNASENEALDLSREGRSEQGLSCGVDAQEPRLVLQLTPRGLSSIELRDKLPGMEDGDGGERVIVARS